MNADNRQEVFGKIKSHPGTQIFEALRAYGTTVRILSGNCFQLRHLICLLEDPADPARVLGYDQRAHLQGLFEEVIRHFHNFLTSITTLVDHTRNLMREDFVRSEHRQEYQTNVNDVFANDPFAQFMQDFRNYITHRAVPIVGLTVRFGSVPHVAELNVDLEKMADWDKWTALSRQFIESHKPKIRMLKLVDDYEQKAKAFSEQLGLTFERYYGEEISGAFHLMREWNKGLQEPRAKA